jgi:hypothetical protein
MQVTLGLLYRAEVLIELLALGQESLIVAFERGYVHRQQIIYELGHIHEHSKSMLVKHRYFQRHIKQDLLQILINNLVGS